MKIKGAKKVHYDSGPNMTPLVDVVMVILIFLMMAGSFGNNEKFMSAQVPLKEKGMGATKKVVPDTIDLTVFVLDAHEGGKPKFAAQVDGVFDSVGNLQMLTSYQQLADALDQKSKEYAANKTLGKVQVFLSPDQNCSWDILSQAYAAALHAKFTHVGFSE